MSWFVGIVIGVGLYHFFRGFVRRWKTTTNLERFRKAWKKQQEMPATEWKPIMVVDELTDSRTQTTTGEGRT